MPNYDYRCDKCGCVVTKFNRIDDRGKEFSCTCGGMLKSTMLIAPGIVFKGSGWTPKSGH